MTGAVVCAPLLAEQVAVRGRASTPVVRSGRGPQGRVPGGADGPVLVVGVAGALAPQLRPGDLVVSDELRTGGVARPSHAAPLMAGTLRALGIRAHVGPVLSRERVVWGAGERSELSATGALVVDTESAFVTSDAPPGQALALRAVVDTADAPLLRPGTAWRGLTALRALREAAPAVDAWSAATGAREVLLAGPRSFCAGVERAVEIVERALERHGAPVYVRRQVVHNVHVVRDLERRGAVFVQEVDDVPEGALVVLAAHGVAPSVRVEARERRLRVVDATCPLVTKVHNEVRRFAAPGSTVFLIGHEEHEEVVGTRAEAPDNVVVVADPADAAQVTVPDPAKVSYVMQTTLAVEEAEQTAAVLRQRFPALSSPRKDDICYATSNRQDAVRAVARESDLVLVVGSQTSSNSLRLAEVAEAAGARAHLVDDASDVDLRWFAGARTVGISAGASAPHHLVDELVRALSGLGRITVRERDVVAEDVRFTLPREVS